ncbi:flagellar M-ring protein FliF [Buchnera aphidicola (Melanaphis sacchari)]|uniref:Flagellar M-ring protein n=1 Tax=Buchnera aphidicola (Melanaphis sacchari) TaxID=2173854 RepID=A0A2U8DFV2_9GAMM|nr:flagellar basal-body MS-ring/collar protein FliF [Buchnera aphidicola]AWH90689.1 flagellar M-ring protein FliF [Buchnera aphidicola (Melanaphis sacchari)]
MNFSAIEESISEEKKKFGNFLSYFFKNSRILIILLMLSVVIAISISVWRKSPDYQVLYSNLSSEDGGAIINQLNEMKIPYQISEDSKQLLVPKENIYNIRLYLAENNLPSSSVGFELLDKEKFGVSQFSEQINYQRALEGEISRTIQKMNVIKNARIHIALPKDSLFLQDQKKPSASVFLILKPGAKLDLKQTNAILHLISSSISGLSTDNITIVDQFGTLLNHSFLEPNQINDLKLKYSEEVESRYRNKIKGILEPLFGIGNVHAQVVAQIDFNSREKTQESYAPNTRYGKQSIRSRQSIIHDEIKNEKKDYFNNVLPKKENFFKKNINNHIYQSNDKNQKNFNTAKDNKKLKDDHILLNSNINRDNTINYELNHTVSHIQSNIGEVKRLSAAVVINYVKDKKGKLVPLTLEQIKNIKNLVCESIGFSKLRGDTVHVINENFSQKNQIFSIKSRNSNQLNFFKDIFLDLLPWFISVIFFILFLKKCLFSSFLNRNLEKNILKNELDKKNKKKENKSLEKDSKFSKLNISNTEKKLSTDKLIHQICNISNQNPRIIASIIRQWMSDKK